MLALLRELVDVAIVRVRERIARAEIALAITADNVRTAKRRRR